MIRRIHKPDGSPDTRYFTVECDRCHTVTDLAGSEPWLIPIDKEMRDYCLLCEYEVAEKLLRSAAPSRGRLIKFAKAVSKIFR